MAEAIPRGARDLPRRPVQPNSAAPALGLVAAPKRVRKNAAVANDPQLPPPSSVDEAKPKARATPPRPRTAKIAPAGALPPARIPAEALRPAPGDRLLAWAFGISVGLHALVLSIHFAPIVIKDLGRSTPIEVALVNAKSKDKPTKADVLAQANLDGGGNTDADRRAKSPLPVLPKDSAQNEITLATQKLDDLERRAKEMLSAMRSAQSVAVAPTPTEATDRPELPTSNEMMQRTLEAMRLEAQIAKDMDAYQKRPKRKFVGARAEEYRFARYVEDWRLKVERVGNLNYPEAARAKKLYGSLVLTVSIRADGSLEGVEVSKPSGQRILDAAAVRIVEMAAPYAAFPPDVRRDTDILHITRTWSFTKGEGLVSSQ
jgi:protein TonB